MKHLVCKLCKANLEWKNGVAIDFSDFRPEVCPGTGERPHWPVMVDGAVGTPSTEDFQAAHIESLEDRLDTAAVRFNFAADWLGNLIFHDGCGKAELILYLRQCAAEANPKSSQLVSSATKYLLENLAKPKNGL